MSPQLTGMVFNLSEIVEINPAMFFVKTELKSKKATRNDREISNW